MSTLVLVALTAIPAGAQERSANPITNGAFGQVSERAAPDLAAMDFLVGEWVVRTFVRDDSGEFRETPGSTSYRARYLFDGLSIMAEFYGSNRDGFYGVHIISHDADRGLIHSYFNAQANRRIEFEGTFVGRGYELSRRGGYGGGDFLYKEVDSEIEPDSFVKRIYQSENGGESWVQGGYYFAFERAGAG